MVYIYIYTNGDTQYKYTYIYIHTHIYYIYIYTVYIYIIYIYMIYIYIIYIYISIWYIIYINILITHICIYICKLYIWIRMSVSNIRTCFHDTQVTLPRDDWCYVQPFFWLKPSWLKLTNRIWTMSGLCRGLEGTGHLWRHSPVKCLGGFNGYNVITPIQLYI